MCLYAVLFHHGGLSLFVQTANKIIFLKKNFFDFLQADFISCQQQKLQVAIQQSDIPKCKAEADISNETSGLLDSRTQ